jgi:hypothetical protein
MKYLFLSCLFVFAFCGCKKVPKDPNNYYPEVKMVDAVVQPDGSVKVRGQIVSRGGSDLTYAGFCMDTIAVPEMTSNQTLASTLDGDMFTCTYTNLNSTTKYYFRAFAANQDGYSYGDVLPVSNASLDSNIIPCHPEINTISMNGTFPVTEHFYDVTEVYQSTLTWGMEASANSMTMYFKFGNYPISGIYQTWENETSADGFVNIRVNGFTVNSGAKVYVKQAGPDAFDIWICDAVVYRQGEDQHFSARLHSPK